MPDATQTTYEKGKLYDLNIADVQPDPEQPRKYFDEQALAELKASIEKHGVLQPVLMRQGADGALLLVSGERRYQASKLAGCTTIPAIFRSPLLLQWRSGSPAAGSQRWKSPPVHHR